MQITYAYSPHWSRMESRDGSCQMPLKRLEQNECYYSTSLCNQLCCLKPVITWPTKSFRIVINVCPVESSPQLKRVKRKWGSPLLLPASPVWVISISLLKTMQNGNCKLSKLHLGLWDFSINTNSWKWFIYFWVWIDSENKRITTLNLVFLRPQKPKCNQFEKRWCFDRKSQILPD